MTDQQIIERLAEFRFGKEIAQKIMDAHKNPVEGNTNMRWNPLKDWNHWRQVEEKVMEDEELWEKFISALDINEGWRSTIANLIYVKSTLRERLEALYTVTKNNHG